MDRLNISSLGGLMTFCGSTGYNLFIPSGFQNRIGVLLSKICKEINKHSIGMHNRKHENMPVTYHFGLKILFDGYLMTRSIDIVKTLIINSFLFDSHLIKEK